MDTELIDKLSNIGVSINSESAVEIARIWQQVQYFRFTTLAVMVFCIVVFLVYGISKSR